jgi:hypothetical protein
MGTMYGMFDPCRYLDNLVYRVDMAVCGRRTIVASVYDGVL